MSGNSDEELESVALPREKSARLVKESMARSTLRNYDTYVRLFESYRADRDSPGYCSELYQEFMMHVAEKYRGSTMAVIGSIIRKYMLVEKGVDVVPDPVVGAVVKSKRKKEKVDHAGVFTAREIMDYLLGLSDEDDFLSKKLMILFGALGGLRASELVQLRFEDVTVEEYGLVINIVRSKTDQSEEGWKVVIPKLDVARADPVCTYERYKKVVPSIAGRLFLQFRYGKYVQQPIGIHQVGGIVQEMAKIVKPEVWKDFSSHSLRRTNATCCVDVGVSDGQMKRHLRWKSTKTAENYVERSLVGELDVAKKLSSAFVKDSEFDKDDGKRITGAAQIVLQGCVLHDCKL